MEWLIGIFVILCFLLLLAIGREENATHALLREKQIFNKHIVEITEVINDNAEVVRGLISKTNETVVNQAFIDARVNLIMEALTLKIPEIEVPKNQSVSKLEILKKSGE